MGPLLFDPCRLVRQGSVSALVATSGAPTTLRHSQRASACDSGIDRHLGVERLLTDQPDRGTVPLADHMLPFLQTTLFGLGHRFAVNNQVSVTHYRLRINPKDREIIADPTGQPAVSLVAEEASQFTVQIVKPLTRGL